MENPLQEIRTPTNYRKKSSRRQTLCPDTIKATCTKLKEQAEFMCPLCGPAFITFPGANGEHICGDCDSLVTEVYENGENTTPNCNIFSNVKKSPFTVRKKLEKVTEIDSCTPVSNPNADKETLLQIEALKQEKLGIEAQHLQTIQDLTLNAEEIKRCELQSLRESLENEWMEKLDEEIQQLHTTYQHEIEETKEYSESQYNALKEQNEQEMKNLKAEMQALRSEYEEKDTAVAKSHTDEIEQLRLDISSKLQTEFEAKEQNMVEKHLKDMEESESQYNALKEQNEQEMKNLKAEMQALRSEYEEKDTAVAKSHTDEIEKLHLKAKVDMEKTFANYQTTHENEIATLKLEFEANVIDLKSQHNSRIETLKEEIEILNGAKVAFESQLKTAQTENFELMEEIKMLNVKLQKQDIDANEFKNNISTLMDEKKKSVRNNDALNTELNDMVEKHAIEINHLTLQHLSNVDKLNAEIHQNALAIASSNTTKFEMEKESLLNQLGLLKEELIVAEEAGNVLKNDMRFAQVEMKQLKEDFNSKKQTLEDENVKLQETIGAERNKYILEKKQAEEFYTKQCKQLSLLHEQEVEKITSVFNTQLLQKESETTSTLVEKHNNELNNRLAELENEMIQSFDTEKSKIKFENANLLSVTIEHLTSKYEALITTMENERSNDVLTWKENFIIQENEIVTLKNLFTSEKETLKNNYETQLNELKDLFHIELTLNKKSFDKSIEVKENNFENELKEKELFTNNLIGAIHEEYASKIKLEQEEHNRLYEQLQESLNQKLSDINATHEEEKNILKNDFRFVKVAQNRQKEKALRDQEKTLKRLHNQQINEINSDNEASIRSLRQSFEAEKGMWNAQHNDDIQRKCKSLQDSLEVMTTTMSSEMEKAHNVAEERCKEFEARFKTFHETEMARINDEHKKEIEKIKLNNGDAVLNAKHEKEVEKLNAAMNEQKNKLETAMKDLTKRLEGEMFIMMESNNEEVAKSEQLTIQLAEATDKIEKLEEDLAEMVKVASGIEENLTDELKCEKLKSMELEGGILKKDEAISKMEQEIMESKAMKESFDKLTNDYKIISEKLVQCEEVKKVQNEKIVNFDKTLKAKIKMFDQKLKAKDKDFEQKITLKTDEVTSLEKKIKEQKKKSEVFETKFKDHCKKQMGKARDMYVLEKQKVATLINEVKNVKTQVTMKEKDIENLMNQNETVKRDLIEFQNKYNKLEAEDKTLKASLFEKGEKITALQAQNKELNVLCGEMMERLENFEQQ